jgi:hypothetical protein
MTKKESEILIRDLSARLPYGIKAEIKYYDDAWELLAIYANGTTYAARDIGYPIETYFEDCKPYLFPLSSMTDEQENEWNNLFHNPLDMLFEQDKTNNANRDKKLFLTFKSMLDPVQWAYKNHFDINGLIPMGLAKDATGLGIY